MPGPRVRALAIALVVLVAILAGVAHLLLRPARADAGKLLADARATYAAGNYHASLANATAAARLAPNAGAVHLMLARAHLALLEGVAAEAEIDRAEAAGIASARLHALRAEARLLQGDGDGATDEAALAGPDEAVAVARITARAAAVDGDLATAQASLAALAARAPSDPKVWSDLGRVRLTAGDIGGAGEASARAYALDRADPAILTLRGEVVRSRYGLEAALPWFAAAVARDAYYYPALIQQAATLGDAGRNTAMLAASRAALVARPGDAVALYLQAALAARSGNWPLATRLMQATGGAIDGEPAAMLLGGASAFARGDYHRAVAGWQALSARQPMNIAVRRLLGEAMLRSGDGAGALGVLGPMAVRADADPYTLALVGRAFERTGDRARAAAFLDRAAALDAGAMARSFRSDEAVGGLAAGAASAADDPTYAIGLIRGLIDAGDLGGATAKARALVAASPGAAAAQLALGDVLMLTGHAGEAATVYARAADLNFDAPTMLRLVDALGRVGRARDAASALALYLAQNPQSVDAHRILGHWQVASGMWEPAIETLEGLRVILGNRDAALLIDLARAYAGEGQDDVALRYARAAYAIAPMSRAATTVYADAAAANGQADAARQLRAKLAGLPG